MILKTRMLGQTYEFKDVKDVLAKASEKKSGDELAGVGAESALERIAAKEVLAQLTVADLTEHPVVPYEEDAVTRIIQDDIDETVYGTIKDRTIQEMREWILCDATDSGALMRASRGMTSEVIAGISKIMSNMDLILAGSKIRVTATCNTTIGTENVLASRLQPNHPVDDVEGVAASTLEGLSYGIGDAVIGLNPAIDTVDSTLAIWKVLGDIRDKHEIPTQTCVLSHVTTQMEALRTRQGSADLCFQSIAGSEAALSAFCDHYAQNVGRSLRGEPLTPCPMDASGRAVRRALMVGATVVCGVVWAVIVVSAALLASGARVTATLGSLVWSGSLPGIIAALALALPGIAGVAAGALARDRRSGFLQGVLALSACEVPVLVVAACSVFSQRAVMGGLVAALVATYTLTWFLLAMGFAFELPVSAPRRTKAQMATPLAGGAAAARTFGGPVEVSSDSISTTKEA